MLKKLSKKIILSTVAVCCMAQAFASDFPVTIEHKFGAATIEKQPERIATLDYQGADDLLALGAQPVAIRYWYGDHPKAVWPWAAEKLTSNPLVIKDTIDYEKLAATKPDVIIALYSGIDVKAYEKLAKIAPVIAVPKGVGDYAMNWDERALTIGRAVGKEKEAQEQVDSINAKITKIADSHPDWKGKKIVLSYFFDDGFGVYGKTDIRTMLLEQFGFELPKNIADLTKEFYIQLSGEQIQLLDADLLMWITPNDEKMKEVKDLAGRKFLNVYKEKREVFLDELEVSAFSHSSLLSLPYVLDRMVIKIEGALNKK